MDRRRTAGVGTVLHSNPQTRRSDHHALCFRSAVWGSGTVLALLHADGERPFFAGSTCRPLICASKAGLTCCGPPLGTCSPHCCRWW